MTKYLTCWMGNAVRGLVRCWWGYGVAWLQLRRGRSDVTVTASQPSVSNCAIEMVIFC